MAADGNTVIAKIGFDDEGFQEGVSRNKDFNEDLLSKIQASAREREIISDSKEYECAL